MYSSEIKISQLITNEAFVAEKDVASASRYRIQLDGLDLGMFKSSGLLVSTGTGSSAWLYAAR
jgi:NAD kinase